MNQRYVGALMVAASLGCRSGGPKITCTIHVAGAISLREPLEALSRSFETEHPGARVALSLGASGELATQIERGAPTDVFASAAEAPALRLAKAGLALSCCVLGTNRLTLIRRADAALEGVGWSTLASDPRVKRVAIGLAPAVAAGTYAEQVLGTLGVLEALAPKLVRGANVRQVLDWVARGEADAGVVYVTDIIGRTDVVAVGEPPASVRPRIVYPLMIAPGAGPEARAFASLLCSDAGRDALGRRGFGPP